jgi:hypothetical protein
MLTSPPFIFLFLFYLLTRASRISGVKADHREPKGSLDARKFASYKKK